MGSGSIKQVLATRVTRGEVEFSVQQDLDTGCRKEALPETGLAKPMFCESRYARASTKGLWVSQIVKRFVNGESQSLRRAVDDPKPEEIEMWQFAQDKIKWARNVSDWVLVYLDKGRQLNLLQLKKIETGAGPAAVIPQCVDRTLMSVAVFFRGANLVVEYTARSEIAPFDAQLCAPWVLFAQNK